MLATRKPAFTLVEVLIVVVLLGVLAAIVIPSFSKATEQATAGGTADQLAKVRNALAVYYVRNGNIYPNIMAGDGTWGELLSVPGYLQEPPRNLWVGDPNDTVINIDTVPDGSYHTAYGWIWDPTTGTLWAASFDAQDNPYPRP